jgi:hypothetical protein
MLVSKYLPPAKGKIVTLQWINLKDTLRFKILKKYERHTLSEIHRGDSEDVTTKTKSLY